MKVERVLSYDFFVLQSQGVKLRTQKQTVSGSVSLSLDPLSARPSVFAAFFDGLHGSITGQIALKMALTGSVFAAIGCVEQGGAQTCAIDVVRAVLKHVNKEVYEYGHRMFVGGKVAGAGTVAVFDGERFDVGRVGPYDTFLFRSGELLQFHPQDTGAGQGPEAAGMRERFFGANAQVLADLAGAAVEHGDLALMFNCALGPELTGEVERELKASNGDPGRLFQMLSQKNREQGLKRVGDEQLTLPQQYAAYGFKFCSRPSAVR